MISKLLVANRGPIAIRAFRADYEPGVGTVAVYPYEDRDSVHRLKADESYQIGHQAFRCGPICRWTRSSGLRGDRDHVRGPEFRGARADRQQGAC